MSNIAAAVAGRRVAVVLSGCGVFDGSEITEAVATLVHLSRAGAVYQCFAPDKMQMHAVDHTSGAEHDASRNVLAESARIARGNIKPLSELSHADYDACILPGGFGAAKNLSSWALEGEACTVDSDVERALKEFHGAAKPLGACCIAPVIFAKVFENPTISVGSGVSDDAKWPYAGTVGQVESLGATHEEKDISGVTVDEQNKLCTSPAYMYEGQPHEIFDSVGRMVDAVLERC